MSLKGRLERLRRGVEALVGAQGTTCDECRRSRSTAQMVHLMDEGEELLDCSACGLPVTSEGVPIGCIGPDGRYRGKIVVLEDDPENEFDEAPL